MTNPIYGSSLFQARKTDHVHHHSHLHNRKSSDTHAHSHAEFHKRQQEEVAELDPRDSIITEVVQTISVIQVIDGSGATLSVQTVAGSSQTDLIDGDTGSTIDVAFKDASTTSSDAGATATSASVISSADPMSASPQSTVSSTSSSVTSTFSTGSATTSLPAGLSLTSISASSSFSSLSSASNSSSSSLTSISSVSSLLSSTSTNSSEIPSTWTSSSTFLSSSSSTTLLSSTTLASSTTSASTDSTFTWSSSDSSSTEWLSSSDFASATSGVGGDGAGIGTATASAGTSSSTATSSDPTTSATATQTREVVGGIFGGIAGIALLVGLAFLILRMKKRGGCHLRLGGDDNGTTPAPRPLPASGDGGGGGGDGSGAYGTMQPTRPQSAVAASLAALAGKRTSRDRSGSGPEMAERGFVRVSGRKLPPVLQYGGDGYTDPRIARTSHMTDASVYRDSMAVFDQPHHNPLTLGSPMRPESGIMTMKPGPGKTPVTNQVPTHIDSPTLPRSSTFPPTDALGRTLADEGYSRDAIGRTLASHDYSRDGAASGASRGSHNSRGSGRFTEHVT